MLKLVPDSIIIQLLTAIAFTGGIYLGEKYDWLWQKTINRQWLYSIM